MAAEDLKSKKRKGAAEAAPKPKKQKKVDDATKSSAKALKSAVAPVDDVVINVKVPRKTAAALFDETKAKVVTADAKAKKSKKGKVVQAAEAEVEKVDAPAAEAPVVKEKKKKKAQATAVKDAPAPEPTAETETKAPAAKAKKATKAKAADESVAPLTDKSSKAKAVVGKEVSADATTKQAGNGKAPKKQKKETASAAPEPAAEPQGSEDEDDQTAALLAGFESDKDSDDPEGDDEDVPEDGLIEIPDEARQDLAKMSKNKNVERGVVYVGRIPHGFHEPQMKGYFSQFGQVTRLRLSRNKKTGSSKHFGFVEFRDSDVAKIVAKTMNNYLLFGHILQCKVIPQAQVHPKLLEGANTRFKVMPRNKMAGTAMERGAERAQWKNRVNRENKKRSRLGKQLSELMDYEFTAPAVKKVDAVPKKESLIENGDGASEQLLIEEAAAGANVTAVVSNPDQFAVTETVTVKKAKKGGKGKAKTQVVAAQVVAEVLEKAVETAVEATLESAVLETQPAKGKKGKKAKAAPAPAPVAEEPIDNVTDKVEPAPAKQKKVKKAKANPAPVVEAPAEDIAENVESAPVKPKKAKKAKKSEPEVPAVIEDIAEPKIETSKAKKAKKQAALVPSPAVESPSEKKRKAKAPEQDDVFKPEKAKKAKA
ncbi:hypothetical protein P154DRAFT_462278 [Amniculicola lignicola CBS 123094]|uniref:RRM domain-containing protein n=1 Tax=Amniculicola lignicola CBS 123094 TaxID=1392246 RepID=A0A6A5WLB3_9PLEO|nr:hypothetical protein P154DRAFT_462278 [Amniculicola lignicola CBS 123094]